MFYNVIRGKVNNIRYAGPVIDLGTASCVVGGTLDESTVGREAFFYLVEYFNGTSSSYGTEGANRPRAAGPGGCQ